MRTWWVVIVPVVLGLAIGLGVRLPELRGNNGKFLPYQTSGGVGEQQTEKVAKLPPGQGPRAQVVGGATFDFGSMELMSQRSHTFEIKNVGTEPLKIVQGNHTCKCTVSDLTEAQLPPGETVKVTLSWTGTDDGPFRQRAEIHTNDPDQNLINLEIEGNVVQTLRLQPTELKLERISNRRELQVTTFLFSANHDNIEVTRHDFLNPELAPYFELTTRPLPRVEVAPTLVARSAQELTIHVKPGLPVGPFQQTIRLVTNLEGEPVLELPITGSSVSDVTLLGDAEFDNYYNILSLGTFAGSKGAESKLHVLVKGPHRDEVELKIGKIEPAGVLKASLGEPNKLGNVVSYPLVVQVEPGAAPINRMGADGSATGQIVLETTHPEVPELKITVKFAVTP